jgi:hypothetical protein
MEPFLLPAAIVESGASVFRRALIKASSTLAANSIAIDGVLLGMAALAAGRALTATISTIVSC